MLYNEVRPETFDEVIGQKITVRNLRNQSKAGKFMGAYIFAGQYGSGKTTIARIMAKAANCENRDENGNPCMRCKSCLEIQKGQTGDIVEIDAASNSGVDNIRTLIEDVAYRPTSLRKKVYIIDEVQRLSKQAFDTLLKTLEEAPSYAMFILCTTDFLAIPGTIRSRAAKYHFSKISEEDITNHLASVADKYNYQYEKAALSIIAKNANGSMRDALSMLEQSIMLQEKVTESAVREMLGIMDNSCSFDLLDAILMRNKVVAMQTVNKLFKSGRNMVYLIDDMLDIISDCITYCCTKDISMISNTETYLKSLISLCEKGDVNRFCTLSEQFMDLRMDYKKTESRTLLVVSMVRACRDSNVALARDNTPVALDTLYDRLSAVENKLAGIGSVQSERLTKDMTATEEKTLDEHLNNETKQSIGQGGQDGRDISSVQTSPSTGSVLESTLGQSVNGEELENNEVDDGYLEFLMTRAQYMEEEQEEIENQIEETYNTGNAKSEKEDTVSTESENDDSLRDNVQQLQQLQKEQGELENNVNNTEPVRPAEETLTFIPGFEKLGGFFGFAESPTVQEDTSIMESDKPSDREEVESNIKECAGSSSRAEKTESVADVKMSEEKENISDDNTELHEAVQPANNGGNFFGFDIFYQFDPKNLGHAASEKPAEMEVSNEEKEISNEEVHESAIEESCGLDEQAMKLENHIIDDCIQESARQMMIVDQIRTLIEQEPVMYAALVDGSMIHLTTSDDVVFETPFKNIEALANAYFSAYNIDAKVCFSTAASI